MNIGAYIDVSGRADNRALYIKAGSICGFRLASKYLTGDKTLNQLENYIVANTSAKNIKITLSGSPEDGQYVVAHKIHYYNALYINGNGKKIYWQNNSAPVSEVFFVGIRVATFLYCKELGAWVGQLSFSDV